MGSLCLYCVRDVICRFFPPLLGEGGGSLYVRKFKKDFPRFSPPMMIAMMMIMMIFSLKFKGKFISTLGCFSRRERREGKGEMGGG